MYRRKKDQHLGALGDPVITRISTPGTLRGALSSVLQYDHDQARSMSSGWLLLSDGRTTIELSPRMRRRLAPLIRITASHGAQLVQLTLLGRVVVFSETAWRHVTRPFRREIPF